MKPTTDIVEELRLYNRWRRGDEAITAPDPTALGKLLDDAADRIEHLFASGIHTCHADCQRPMCVLRRERDKAQNDLARVTAELEHHKSVKETIDSAHKELSREHAALRARVAELEATIAELTTDGNAATLAANLAKASKRNAELEAQIERDAWAISPAMAQARINMLASELGQVKQRNVELEAALLEEKRIHPEDFLPGDFRERALARAESAAPAKHPDTDGERLGSFATVCPKCGAQTMDPFTGTRQIHDVAACVGIKVEGAR